MVALMFGVFPESGTRESLVFAAVAAAGAALVSFSRLTGKRGRSGQPSHT
jgi:ABC-type cobalt transport system substrate-binding protein